MFLNTDQRAIGAPFPRARVPVGRHWTRVSDLADNGNLNFYIDVAWDPITAESEYSIKIVNNTDSTTQFKRVDNAVSGGKGRYRLPVTSGKNYTTYVRAIGADGGTPGDWSTGTSITVTKKNTAPITPTVTPVVTAGFKQNSVKAGKSTESDVVEVVFYRADGTNNFTTSANEVGRSRTTKFTDGGLTNGTPYYYWYTYVDSSGNESAKWPSSNTGGIVGTPLKTLAGDYAAGSIADADTNQSAPTVPSAVTVSQYNKDLNGDGTVDVALKIAFTVPTGAKGCVLQISDGTETWYEYPKKSPYRLKFALVGVTYSVAVASVGFNNVESAFNGTPTTFTPTGRTNVPATIGTVGVFQMFSGIVISWDYSTEKDYAYTEVQKDDNALFTTATVRAKSATSFFVEPLADTIAASFYRIRNVSTSGAVGAWRVLDNLGAGYKRGLIQYFDIDSNAVSNFFTTGTNTSVACAAGTAQLVESLGVTYFDGTTYIKSNYIEVDFEFRNNSGSARTMDITLEDAATAGASVLRTWPSVVLQDGNMFKSRVVVQSHTGTSKTLRLRVNMTAAGSVIRTRLDGMVRNR